MILFIGVPLRAPRLGSTLVSRGLWPVDSRCRHGHCSWHRITTSQKMGRDSSLTLIVVSRLLVSLRGRPSKSWRSRLAGLFFRDTLDWPRNPHCILLAHPDMAQEIRCLLSLASAKRSPLPDCVLNSNGPKECSLE